MSQLIQLYYGPSLSYRQAFVPVYCLCWIATAVVLFNSMTDGILKGSFGVLVDAGLKLLLGYKTVAPGQPKLMEEQKVYKK